MSEIKRPFRFGVQKMKSAVQLTYQRNLLLFTQHSIETRAEMLVLYKDTGKIEHRQFKDLLITLVKTTYSY